MAARMRSTGAASPREGLRADFLRETFRALFFRAALRPAFLRPAFLRAVLRFEPPLDLLRLFFLVAIAPPSGPRSVLIRPRSKGPSARSLSGRLYS